MQERCRSQAGQPGFQGFRCLKARSPSHLQACERCRPSLSGTRRFGKVSRTPSGTVWLARLVQPDGRSYMDGDPPTVWLHRRIPVLLAVVSVVCAPARGIGSRVIHSAYPTVHAPVPCRSHDTLPADAYRPEQETAGSSTGEHTPARVGLISRARIEDRPQRFAPGSSAPVPLSVRHPVATQKHGVTGACRAPVYLRHVSLLL